MNAICLEWVHSRAARDRWWEEKTLLLAELERVGLTFRYQASFWQRIADTQLGAEDMSKQVRKGIRVNAAQCAAMFVSMAVDVEQRRQSAVVLHPQLNLIT